MSQAILDALGSNGVDLSLKELLRYRVNPPPLASRRQAQARMGVGQRLSRGKGRGMEFDEVRHYQAGDDIRTIDWRVTARTGKPHTKLFRAERERPVLLLLMFSPSLFFGSRLLLKSVQAGHLAAALGWQALAHGDRIGAVLSAAGEHRELQPKASRRSVLRLLHHLVEMHAQQQPLPKQRETDWEDALARLQRVARPGSQIHLICDRLPTTAAIAQRLSLLQRHAQCQLWQLFDPLERDLQPLASSGALPVTVNRQSGFLLPGDPQFQQRYRQQAQTSCDHTARWLQRLAIDLIPVSAAEPLSEQFRRTR